MKNLSIHAVVITCMFALAGGAQAQGNAASGKRVFSKCKACHSLKAGKKKVGPSLYGVFGAKAAMVKGFRYSKGMKKSGIVCDEASLVQFLKKPR